MAHGPRSRPTLESQTAHVAAWVRQGKVKAFALSGTRRRIWRFRRGDLDSTLRESTVLHSIPLSVRCSKEKSID